MKKARFKWQDLEPVYEHLKNVPGIEFKDSFDTIKFVLNARQWEVIFMAASGYATMVLKMNGENVGSFWALKNLDELLNKNK